MVVEDITSNQIMNFTVRKTIDYRIYVMWVNSIVVNKQIKNWRAGNLTNSSWEINQLEQITSFK